MLELAKEAQQTEQGENLKQVFRSRCESTVAALQVEASRMAEAIQHFRAAGVRGQDIAVLYPKHVYGERVEQALLVQRIPYRRYGNVTIMDRHTSLCISYFCTVVNECAGNPQCSTFVRERTYTLHTAPAMN